MEERGVINIHYGDKNAKPVYTFISTTFHHVYERHWLLSDFAKKVIKEIDKSEVLGNGACYSEYLGVFAPEHLSGGAKTLIASYELPNEIFPLRNLGENCAPLLHELSLLKTTNWFYVGYIPPLPPKQKLRIMEADEIFQIDDVRKWLAWNAPNPEEILETRMRGFYNDFIEV